MKDEIKTKITKRYSQAEIGRHLGCMQQSVSLWFNSRVPASRVIQLCELLQWDVTPHELRPDIYPKTTDGLPSDGVTLPPSTEGGLNNGDQA